ncbi:MAG: hypothetical protein PHS82_11770 [Lachnospiraceae bacterium]|nr:hypothetical protein [Lachnospiraceae bacterium]
MDEIKECKCCVKSFFDKEWSVSEKILLVVDCILFGIVLGAIWSPKRYKHTIMGSYNSGNGCNTGAEEAKEETEE